MAAFGGKRRQNVRSTTSRGNVESIEDYLVTGYMSDNSMSGTEMGISREEREVTYKEKNGNIFPPCNFLKKEFALTDGGKWTANHSEEVDCNKPTRKRPKCSSKNAVMARLNRMKKKKHVEEMEGKISELSEENCRLKEAAEKHNETVQKLNDEIQYLKNVLANSREISMLLKSVRVDTGLPVTSSVNKHVDRQLLCKESLFVSGESCDDESSERMEEFDPDTFLPQSFPNFHEDPVLSCGNMGLLSDTMLEEKSIGTKFMQSSGTKSSDVGICLHVAQRRVCLEFCSTCNSNASTSWEDH